jgi:hypothetical protein
MMKNNPNDVTSLLTELMERISDEDLTDEKSPRAAARHCERNG